MKRYSEAEIITKIGLIREANNLLWMGLLKIAIESAPEKTKKLLRKINKNDKEISKWVSRL